MKIYALVVVSFICSFLLYSESDRNYTVGWGSSITNYTFESEKIIDPFNLKFSFHEDMIIHQELNLGYNLNCFKNGSLFSIRSDLSFNIIRQYADISVSLAYNLKKSQFHIGPLLAHDGYFYLSRSIFDIFNLISDDGKEVQDYWHYLGIEVGYRYNLFNHIGFNIKYRQSLWNIISLHQEELSHYLNRFNFLTIGIFYRF